MAEEGEEEPPGRALLLAGIGMEVVPVLDRLALSAFACWPEFGRRSELGLGPGFEPEAPVLLGVLLAGVLLFPF